MLNLTSAQGILSDGGVLVETSIHFDDLDSQGLLHNSHYSVLAERAWITYFMQQEGFQFLNGGTPVGDGFAVVKEMQINYEYPVTELGPIGVHLWVNRIGTASLTHGFQVCSADGSLRYAHGTRTLVRLDPQTLRPLAWSAQARSLCERMKRHSQEDLIVGAGAEARRVARGNLTPGSHRIRT
jgi:acyl-CoA thioester hydrolase